MEEGTVTLKNNMAVPYTVKHVVLGIATKHENMCPHKTVYANYS